MSYPIFISHSYSTSIVLSFIFTYAPLYLASFTLKIASHSKPSFSHSCSSPPLIATLTADPIAYSHSIRSHASFHSKRLSLYSSSLLPIRIHTFSNTRPTCTLHAYTLNCPISFINLLFWYLSSSSTSFVYVNFFSFHSFLSYEPSKSAPYSLIFPNSRKILFPDLSTSPYLPLGLSRLMNQVLWPSSTSHVHFVPHFCIPLIQVPKPTYLIFEHF